MSVLTADLVLAYLEAQEPGVLPFKFDFEFTPERVENAFRFTAMEFNSIPPLIMCADPKRLPAHDNTFLDGVASHLYAMELRALTKEDMDYTTGGVGTNLVKARIEHLTKLVSDHRERFRVAAKTMKLIRNVNNAYGHY